MVPALLDLRLRVDGAGFGGGGGRGRGGHRGGRGGGRGGGGRGGGRGGRRKQTVTYQPSERKAARKAARQQKKQRRASHVESTKTANAARADLATENESLKRQLAALQAQVSGKSTGSSQVDARKPKRRKIQDQDEGSPRERPRKNQKQTTNENKTRGHAKEPSDPGRAARLQAQEMYIEREDEQIRRMDALLGKRKKKRKSKKGKKSRSAEASEAEEDADLGFDSDTSDEFLSELLGDLSTYKDYIAKQRSSAGVRDSSGDTQDHNDDGEKEEHQRAEEMLRRMKNSPASHGDSDSTAEQIDEEDSEGQEDSEREKDSDDSEDEEDEDEDESEDAEDSEDNEDSEDENEDEDKDQYGEEDDDDAVESEDNSASGEDSDSDSEGEESEGSDDQDSNSAPAVAPSGGAYVPPALRAKMNPGAQSGQASMEEQRLQNRVRGLINRLSDNNKTAIGKEILDVFRDNPRRWVTDAVAKVVLGAVSGTQNLGGVSAEYLSLYAALLCYLHVQTGGGATGAHFLEGCAKQLEKALDTETRNVKAASNIVQIFAYFFLVEMISANLIYDLIRKFCEELTELDVEMVLLLLRTCGFKIRQDDPISLKEIILLVEKQAAAKAAGESMQREGVIGADAEAGQTSSKRLEFMLSTISDLRNNRERPSDTHGGVKSRAKILMDWVYSKESKGGGVDSGEATLPVRLETLLAPDNTKKGLWWMEARLERGRLRKGTEDSNEHGDETYPELNEPEMSTDLLALARKMHMSTDVRKAIFFAVMGAEDYAEASRELAKLEQQLKPPQDREIIRVIFACCTQEKSYNPYYAVLLRSVCGAHGAGNHAYTLRFCFWDLLKDADGVSRHKLENAAQLLASLLLDKSPRIGWDCIKPVEWLELSDHPGQRLFLRKFCRTLLAHARSKVVFATLRSRADLATVLEGLSTFSHNHLPEDMSAALSTVLPAPAAMSAAA